MNHTLLQRDNSGYLVKYFAFQVVRFLEHPELSLEACHHVPLENLFRLLEMYRHDTYSDGHDNPDWYVEIVKALDLARLSTFGDASPKDVVIDELEKSLRRIAVPPHEVSDQVCDDNTKKFFSTFNEVFQ